MATTLDTVMSNCGNVGKGGDDCGRRRVGDIFPAVKKMISRGPTREDWVEISTVTSNKIDTHVVKCGVNAESGDQCLDRPVADNAHEVRRRGGKNDYVSHVSQGEETNFHKESQDLHVSLSLGDYLFDGGSCGASLESITGTIDGTQTTSLEEDKGEQATRVIATNNQNSLGSEQTKDGCAGDPSEEIYFEGLPRSQNDGKLCHLPHLGSAVRLKNGNTYAKFLSANDLIVMLDARGSKLCCWNVLGENQDQSSRKVDCLVDTPDIIYKITSRGNKEVSSKMPAHIRSKLAQMPSFLRALSSAS
mmetsp:Transcript_27523/g.40662  ORF Transcript_27523/g.40662 Transcript_27523/m.40662 type:complete len:304 (-) Transcript_27523:131-1042(-)